MDPGYKFVLDKFESGDLKYDKKLVKLHPKNTQIGNFGTKFKIYFDFCTKIRSLKYCFKNCNSFENAAKSTQIINFGTKFENVYFAQNFTFSQSQMF